LKRNDFGVALSLSSCSLPSMEMPSLAANLIDSSIICVLTIDAIKTKE
jgi:hypothetical protein